MTPLGGWGDGEVHPPFQGRGVTHQIDAFSSKGPGYFLNFSAYIAKNAAFTSKEGYGRAQRSGIP